MPIQPYFFSREDLQKEDVVSVIIFDGQLYPILTVNIRYLIIFTYLEIPI